MINSMTFTRHASGLTKALEKRIEQVSQELDYTGLQADYERMSVALIKGFLTSELTNEIRKICYYAIKQSGYERDLTLKTTDYSPRKYTSVGYNGVKKHAPVTEVLHESPVLKEIIAKITGLNPQTPEFEAERYIINQQHGVGHTHGWHWDDYSLAVGLCIDDASNDYGGRLECVPHTSWDKNKPNIREVLAENSLYSIKPKSGDFYINRADTTLHRVTPLEDEKSVRTMIIMSYQTQADAGKDLKFETMEELYPEDCA